MGKGNGGTRSGVGGRGNAGRVERTDEGIRSFLLGYTPKEQGWTSNEEIDLISSRLGLNDMDDSELRSLRNKVVTIYHDAQEREIRYDENGDFAGRSEKYWDYSEGMMSVTAVIDEIRRRKGTPISML